MSTNRNEIDKGQARELFLFATNDGELYRQTITPAIENFKRKIKRGIFNEEKAIGYFSNSFARMALEKYRRQIGDIGIMNKATKEIFGKDVYEYYKESIEVNA